MKRAVEIPGRLPLIIGHRGRLRARAREHPRLIRPSLPMECRRHRVRRAPRARRRARRHTRPDARPNAFRLTASSRRSTPNAFTVLRGRLVQPKNPKRRRRPSSGSASRARRSLRALRHRLPLRRDEVRSSLRAAPRWRAPSSTWCARTGSPHRVVVKSFEHDSLAEVKRLAPEIRTAALFGRSWPRPFVSAAGILAAAEACAADEISLHRSLLRKSTVEEARRAASRC